jgi:hypothetical protein
MVFFIDSHLSTFVKTNYIEERNYSEPHYGVLTNFSINIVFDILWCPYIMRT